jgi:GNAT superfamily N-acetyltransferase
MECDWTIRSASPGDESGIKRLLKAEGGMWQGWWRDDAVAIAIASAGDLALVAVRDERILGFACVHDVGFRAYLSEIVVAESERGSGIGHALLTRAETMLGERGCQLIIADAYPPAVNFYERQGWGRPDAVLISRQLDSETYE